QEVLWMLDAFSLTPPEQIFEQRRKGGMSSRGGSPPAPASGGMKGMTLAPGMKMDAKPDLNDVTYDAFLANDRTLGNPEVVKVEPGGRVLLRVINSSSMSAFHVDLGALDGELTAVDGFPVAPVACRRCLIALAQRLG